MKSLVYIFFFTLVAFASNVIRDGSLVARSDGNNVTIQWGSADESQVKEYVVERRASTNGQFESIGVVAVTGSNSLYEYIDRSAFKTTGTVYQYRIRIVDVYQAVSYSSVITVTHNVSSVKRTWGSLKAMFR